MKPEWYSLADYLEERQQQIALESARAKVREGFDELFELNAISDVKNFLAFEAERLPRKLEAAE